MNNITQQWRDGWLEDQSLERYEKLKSSRHKINDDKERTVQLKKSRALIERCHDDRPLL
jgi:hypothetical protein